MEHAATIFHHKLFVHGGFVERDLEGTERGDTALYIFDLHQKQWLDPILFNLPRATPRASAGFSHSGPYLVLCGGRMISEDTTSMISRVCVFDTIQMRWILPSLASSIPRAIYDSESGRTILWKQTASNPNLFLSLRLHDQRDSWSIITFSLVV